MVYFLYKMRQSGPRECAKTIDIRIAEGVSHMKNNKNHILIADDDNEIREVLTILLTAEGYEVTAARDGQDGLDLADETTDLYILDVNMPNVSGFAAGAEIRRKYYAPILFLTAYSGESDKVMGFSVGADDYIVKPFSNTELLLRVRAHLRRAQVYAPSSASRQAESGIQTWAKRLFPDHQGKSGTKI